MFHSTRGIKDQDLIDRAVDVFVTPLNLFFKKTASLDNDMVVTCLVLGFVMTRSLRSPPLLDAR